MSEMLLRPSASGIQATAADFTLVWIGPDSEASAPARAAFGAWADDVGARTPVWAPTLAAASSAIGGAHLLVVFDVTAEGVDWHVVLNALRMAAPESIALGWTRLMDHPSVTPALVADVDWVVWGEAPPSAFWERGHLHAAARLAVRRRTNNEAAYRTFFAVTPMPAAVVDEAGRVVVANASFVRAFGEDAVKQPVLARLDAATREREGAGLRAVLAGAEEVHAAEFTVETGEAHHTYVLHLFRTRNEGRGTCFAAFREVLDPRAVATALRERERHVRLAFEQAAVGISVMPAHGGWVEINPALQRMLGLPPQVTRQRVMECTHPEDRVLDSALFAELLAGERTSYQVEKRYINEQTGAITEGIYSLTMERDEAGAPSALIGTILDVTERRRAERARAESELRFRAFFDHAPVGLCVFDPATGVGEANEAYQRFAGLPDHRITLSDLRDATYPEDRADHETLIADVLAGRQVYGVRERRRRRMDGAERWGRKLISTARNADGTASALFVTLEDVTERHEAQVKLAAALERAQAADRAKSAFLATMTHELRTPMNGVVGMAQVLETTALDEEQRGCLTTILSCADQMLTLIGEVLEFSKLEAGRVELESRPFDLRQLVEEAVAVVAPQGMAKGLRVTTAVAPGVPRELVGDPHRLRQVLLNYLSNAVKFTRQGAVTATLSAASVGERRYEVQIAVEDTGIGIPADRQERLFQLFSQVDAGTTREFGGTGLGLAISKRLADLMGGRVWVDSRPGAGSTFGVALTLALAGGPAVPHALPAPDRSGRRVLVVEDNEVNRLVARKMLERLGVSCDQAVDGAEGVAMVEEAVRAGRPYSLILMDVRMPVMDGLVATRHLRATLPPESQPYVVAFSANAGIADQEEYTAAGVDESISKPVAFPALQALLERTATAFPAAPAAASLVAAGGAP